MWTSITRTAVFLAVLFLQNIGIAKASAGADDQQRLVKDLFQGYNKLIRPGKGVDDLTTVIFAINLGVIIFLNDQHQVLKINGYIDLRWNDERLQFDQAQYGGNISTLRMPPGKVWLPEVALVSTTDGKYDPSYKANLLISPDGSVQWVPPFIYKSSCYINPRFFPFDEQICKMYFRSLTYNSEEVSLVLGSENFEIKDYRNQTSGTWDLLGAPIFTRRANISGVMRDYVECHLRLRRKSLFYVITILLPCVLICFLTCFVFLLPSRGKTNVCLSILFAIVVFLLLMSDILPAADTLPLLSEFLFFSFCMNILSAFFTVVSMNINYRGPHTHIMPAWMKVIFLQFLPALLCIRRPRRHTPKPRLRMNKSLRPREQYTGPVALYHNPQCTTAIPEIYTDEERNVTANCRNPPESSRQNRRSSPILQLRLTPVQTKRMMNKATSPIIVSQRSIDSIISREVEMFAEILAEVPGYQDALKAVAYIAANMERKTDKGEVSDDWKFMSQVLDRLLLWIFFIVSSAGSMGIILNSPFLFDYTPSLTDIK